MLQPSAGGEVVAFRPGVVRVRPDSGDDATVERGRILLFTGVRYERLAEPAPNTAADVVDDEIYDGASLA